MDTTLEFVRGPLFRLSFGIMVLGLARILILDFLNAFDAYRRAGDKNIPFALTFRRSLEWLVPVKRVFRNRPFYSIFSILFHVGLLLVPILLYAHMRLWEQSIGIGWLTLPKLWADILTLTTIIFGLALVIGRIGSRTSRFISRKQDYLWPLLLIVPFVTGFIGANLSVSPAGYNYFMLVHILAGDLIFVLLPFTKIAHCVLLPFSQFVSVLAWKFPADTDDAVCSTLNKKGAPV